MKTNLNFLLVSLTLFFSLNAGAQRISFQRFTNENGLSQNSVLSITQDKRGFMWFGTMYSLNKFDTRKFKTYNSEPRSGNLSSSTDVRALLADSENILWVGTTKGLNRYEPASDSFKQLLTTAAPVSISDNLVNCIFQDTQKRVWIGTGNGLNLLLDRKNNRFLRYFYHGGNMPRMNVYDIVQDRKGVFWMSTSQGLISFSLNGNKAIVAIHPDFDAVLNAVPDNLMITLAIDHDDQLWVGTRRNGLIRMDISTGRLTAYAHNDEDPASVCSNDVRKILVRRNGEIWVGTLRGLNIYHKAKNNFEAVQHDPDDPTSLSQNSVYEIFEDRQGNMWVGTYFGGVSVSYPNLTAFHIYRNSKFENSISSNIVSALIEDRDHNYWIGTEGEGLNFLNGHTGRFTIFKNSSSKPGTLSSNLVKAIFQDSNGDIWVGTHRGGLNLFHPDNHSFSTFTHDLKKRNSISSNDVTCILQDSHHRFWVGTNKGLNLLDPATGKFTIWPVIKNYNNVSITVSCIYEDHEGGTWLGTLGGVFYMRKDSEQFEYVVPQKTNCITEDGKGIIWMGTYHKGLLRYDHRTGGTETFTAESGLTSNNVLGILFDASKRLWATTDNGLVCYDGKSIKTYNTKDGLPGNEFNGGSYLRATDGKLFFGSFSGLVAFDPANIVDNEFSPPVEFTDIRLFNHTVAPGKDQIIHQAINMTDEITLRYDQNVVSFDFAALNFINPGKNRYAYKLQGFEKNWNNVKVPTATYTNLSPGSYDLLVKGSNDTGVWSKYPARLRIIVLPPLWRSWWAYLIYLVILTGIIFIFARLVITRALLENEKAVHQMKLNFFTNISHEIRTPLTLITGPLEQLMNERKEDAELHMQIQLVKKNADRLTKLVTELLDFRKAESGKLKLQVSSSNVVQFVHEIFLAFQSEALCRHMSYQLESSHDTIDAYFDKDQFEKVIFNLLSNAFKFTPDCGHISLGVKLNAGEVFVTVTDDGIGIPKEKQSGIFSNFYQADSDIFPHNGSGLGLALSKSIMEHHAGALSFESFTGEKGKTGRTVFTVMLKCGKDHFSEQHIVGDHLASENSDNYYLEEDLDEPSGKFEQPENIIGRDFTILVIENNKDVRSFIINSLGTAYHMIESDNGAEGLRMVTEQLPDLIISDVMMPEMDGFEVCRKVKTDNRTSHIPVVLLTARAAYIHRVTGLETGADAYITKPFSIKLLKLTIRNLLAARDLLKEKFTRTLTLQPQNITINSTEEIFITRVLRFIENNMTNPQLSVSMLASEVGMSQPVLYKKIRALTDLPVNEFIKSIRLKKAVQLLEQKQLSIYEVAYAVGFNDRKYFSQEFKKFYGKPPSEFVSGLTGQSPKPSNSL